MVLQVALALALPAIHIDLDSTEEEGAGRANRLLPPATSAALAPRAASSMLLCYRRSLNRVTDASAAYPTVVCIFGPPSTVATPSNTLRCGAAAEVAADTPTIARLSAARLEVARALDSLWQRTLATGDALPWVVEASGGEVAVLTGAMQLVAEADSALLGTHTAMTPG
jgi:hypothetical protein